VRALYLLREPNFFAGDLGELVEGGWSSPGRASKLVSPVIMSAHRVSVFLV
jgi:hypothetical protein